MLKPKERDAIINAVDSVVNIHGMAEDVTDHILIDGIDNVTIETLTEITVRPEDADRDKTMTEAGAKRILAAIEFYKAMNAIRPKKKSTKVNPVEQFLSENSEEQVNQLTFDIAHSRCFFEGKKPPAWNQIRRSLNIHHDVLHKHIRLSERYRVVVETIINDLIQDGWDYEGDLHKLAGFQVKKELVSLLQDNINLKI